jgi:hypothetical protein
MCPVVIEVAAVMIVVVVELITCAISADWKQEKLVLINFHLPFIQRVNTAKRLKGKSITLERIRNRAL